MRHLPPLVLAACLLAGCPAKADHAADPAASAAPPGIAVETSPAVTGAIESATTLSGDIRSSLEATLAAKVGGRLATLAVDEGSRVAAGQVVGRIDARDYELQVLQARATLASAIAARAQAVTRTKTTDDNLRRYTELHQEGAISEQQIVGTRAEAEANRNAVLAADAQIAQARASIAIAEKAVADTAIRAPFAGVVTKKSAEVGAMLSPMTGVATLAAVSTLELQVPVGQGQLGHVKVGQKATFTVPTHAGRTFEARVAEIAPTVDPRTRTAQLTFRIPNQAGLLAPGMFARATLPTKVREDATLVPPAALVSEGEDQFVFVVKAGKAERRKVAVGIRTPDRVEIASGLTAGEPVVTLGQGQLQPGDAVRVVGEAK